MKRSLYCGLSAWVSGVLSRSKVTMSAAVTMFSLPVGRKYRPNRATTSGGRPGGIYRRAGFRFCQGRTAGRLGCLQPACDFGPLVHVEAGTPMSVPLGLLANDEFVRPH